MAGTRPPQPGGEAAASAESRATAAGPPASEGVKQPREAYQAQDAGIFWHIFSYWRSDRDPPPV